MTLAGYGEFYIDNGKAGRICCIEKPAHFCTGFVDGNYAAF